MAFRQTPFRCLDHRFVLRYKSARGPLAVHQSVPLQLRQSALHGVGIDARLRGEVTHRWQPLPRRERAGDDADLDLLDELGVDRGVVGKLPFQEMRLLSVSNVLSN